MTATAELADAQLIWDYHQMHHPAQPASLAIGLGSHDLGVAAVAADRYLSGLAPLLLFTGGNSPTTRERMPRGEAVHYKEHAMELGVPETAILVEPEATNTGENITLSRKLSERVGVDVSSATLVCKPYEERRAYATARKLWPGVDFTCASSPMTLAQYVNSIGDERLVIDMLVGALQRLTVYPAQGFMIEQPVPTNVNAAYTRLVAAGHTSRLLRRAG
ncbi:YdcF family protein [Streptomyces sp. 549]|uniref:YdcF family protein n=1 Tax=Streptomyces sp. 549 TaxID=3049076 RepID=UPI0024C34024|nr:YdcF family protein [Streptomyces sp. 549]MDK1474963.1 YdcF family protein [Streptomyces sp. 549]